MSVRYAFKDSNGWLYSAGCAVTSDLKPVQPGKTRLVVLLPITIHGYNSTLQCLKLTHFIFKEEC